MSDTIDRVSAAIAGVPFMSPEQGKHLYRFLVDRGATACLELGFAHGVGTAYMAAAMEDTGGHVTGVDILNSLNWTKPTAEETVARTGLSHRVTLHREVSSYTWWLKTQIEAQTRDGICTPVFDFVYIDGPKHWTIDGAAFFMADKLLKPGGTILFDDYGWTHDGAVAAVDDPLFARMSNAELHEPQIKAVFHLLVAQHPDYSNFRIENDAWAWAEKTASPRKQVKVTAHIDARARVLNVFRTVRQRLRSRSRARVR